MITTNICYNYLLEQCDNILIMCRLFYFITIKIQLSQLEKKIIIIECSVREHIHKPLTLFGNKVVRTYSIKCKTTHNL